MSQGRAPGRLDYDQEVFLTIYNLSPVSKHIKLLTVHGDKYSRMKLENTKKKLMKFRDTANLLDKHW